MTRLPRDHAFMGRALALATGVRLITRPNPAVGCVLARGDIIVAEGATAPAGGPHAEAAALAAAGDAARGTTAYVTLEPCAHHGRTPPCADALIAAGVARVVVALRDPFPAVAGAGIARLQAVGIEVDTTVAAEHREAAIRLNAGFLKRHATGQPRVVCKLAQSIDGRTAAADGTSQWITSPQSRARVQRLRAAAGAIVTGAGTLRTDDPRLNVRDLDSHDRRTAAFLRINPPLRVVVGGPPPRHDSQLRKAPGEVWWVHAGASDAKSMPQFRVCELPGSAGRVDLDALMNELAAANVNDVLLEAGATLAGAFLEADLVDELVIHCAPKLLGDAGRPLAVLSSLQSLDQSLDFEFEGCETVGPDLELRLRRVRPHHDALQ